MKLSSQWQKYLIRVLLFSLVLSFCFGIVGHRLLLANDPNSNMAIATGKQDREKPLVVFYGSSTIAGFGASRGDRRWTTLMSRYLGWQEMNEGVSGSTIIRYHRADGALWDTVSGVERWRYSVVNRQPDLVVIMYGANDTYRRLPLNLVKKDLKTMLGGLSAALTPEKLIVLTPQPNSATIDHRNLYDLALQKGAEEVGAFFIDAGKEGYSPKDLKDYALDGLHMNDLGHAALASFLANKMVEFGISSPPPTAKGGNALEEDLQTLAGGYLHIDAANPLTFGKINNLEVQWGQEGEAILAVMRPDARGGYDLVYRTNPISVTPGTSRVSVPGWWVLDGDRLAVWTREDCLLAAPSASQDHLSSSLPLKYPQDIAPELIKIDSYRLAIRTLKTNATSDRKLIQAIAQNSPAETGEGK